MTTPALIPAIKMDEGFRALAYLDTTGLWTIGYGHHDLHTHAGMSWTQAFATNQLSMDISQAEMAMDRSPSLDWWRHLSDPRQDVLVNMGFNLGVAKLVTFITFLPFVKSGQYAQAADDMLTTDWAKEVGARADRLALQMRTGELQQ